MTRFELRRHNGPETIDLIDQVADVYVKGYADDPDIGHSIYARDEFTQRTTRQAHAVGFVMVTAHSHGQWRGFSFGLPFPAGRWWAGELEDQPSDELLMSDKFAVIELVVLPTARGVGLATQLMSAILQGRPEPWATLLADQAGHARSIYDRWGWERLSTIRLAPDVPPLDILVRPLRSSS